MTSEQYNLSLNYPSITNGVTLGPDTIIHIIDDDGKPKITVYMYCLLNRVQ